MTWRHVRKKALLLFGVLFIVFGLGAFVGVPGGHDASHHTIGHNFTHLFAGLLIVCIALAAGSRTRQRFSFAFGSAYLAIGIMGLFSARDSLRIVPGLLEFHLEDAWVQIGTGALFIFLGCLKRVAKVPESRRPVLAT